MPDNEMTAEQTEEFYSSFLKLAGALKFLGWATLVYTVSVIGFNWMMFFRYTASAQQSALMRSGLMSSVYSLGIGVIAAFCLFALGGIIKLLIRIDETMVSVENIVSDKQENLR